MPVGVIFSARRRIMGKRIGLVAVTTADRQRQFEALLREHRRIVFKVAAVYAQNAPDRDDLAQDIAVQLWRSFGAFDARRAKFSTWMYRVALNVAISHARNAKRSGVEQLHPLHDAHMETVADGSASQHEALEHDQRGAVLHALIDGLDVLSRALVVLYLEDRSYAEIADVLGISETSVATKLNRIKQKLRGQVAAAQATGA